jgi:NIMA (never in mitosis gene a)-related kinase
VYKVLRKSDGQEYAMKKVRMNGLSAKEKQNALNEVRILASVQSPYIVGYKEAFFDQQENSLFIILEYIAGGDLQSKINYVRKKGQGFYFDEAIIWTYLIHMLKGLNALHK